MTAVAEPFIFPGGQMTDLPTFPNAQFDGTELFEIVWGTSEETALNYSIPSQTLATLLNKFISNTPTILTSGATLGTPYNVLTTDTRVLFNKTIASASYAVLGLSQTYPVTILFKDLKGDADVNPISLTFTSGQLCDGLATIPINTRYGFVALTPLAAGGWYVSGGG